MLPIGASSALLAALAGALQASFRLVRTLRSPFSAAPRGAVGICAFPAAQPLRAQR